MVAGVRAPAAPRRGVVGAGSGRTSARRGTIVVVITVLFYFVIAAVIGLVMFFLAVFVFGRGEQMAPLDPRTSPAELPDHDVTSEDVRKVRFALALRGYRMSDVDWTLERLGDQIDTLSRENAELRREARPDSHEERLAADDLVPVGALGWAIGEKGEAGGHGTDPVGRLGTSTNAEFR